MNKKHNDEKNAQLYTSYKELAYKEEKVSFGGRFGKYKYCDIDAVFTSGL
ncbi:MAG: UDP-galactopyranose mutase [Lachnospiraceae bacterium]|nr:UDP-galactopyranose mutase [Lachnospiraceae bacterium]